MTSLTYRLYIDGAWQDGEGDGQALTTHPGVDIVSPMISAAQREKVEGRTGQATGTS